MYGLESIIDEKAKFEPIMGVLHVKKNLNN